MTSYSQRIKGKYGVSNYQETKNTYDWIRKITQKMDIKNGHIDVKFQFKIGEITCVCDSIEEFVMNAYETPEYSFISATISFWDGGRSVFIIIIDHTGGLRINTDSKAILEQVVSLLNETELFEMEVNDPISVTYIKTQNNNAPTINGNNNTINTGSNDKESKIKQWIKAIAQNLLANWIWYLLTAAIAVGATYLATR